MIELIIKINPDAVVTDFMLNDAKVDIKYNVPYNGSILVKSFTENLLNSNLFLFN